MFYKQLKIKGIIIEFFNDWLGKETVTVNGEKVSSKYSIWGTDHFFNVKEKGFQTRYILTSKINMSLQILIDLSSNGINVLENIVVPLKSQSKKLSQSNPNFHLGIKALDNYDLEDALGYFKMALENTPKNPKIYFNIACIYSLQENIIEGFQALELAMQLEYSPNEDILNNDKLAFLRIQKKFERFKKNWKL